MKNYIAILFATLLLFGACKKTDLPEPQEGAPAIWMKCKMNGFPFEFKVGEQNVFANNFIYTNTSNNVRQFTFRIESMDNKKSVDITLNNYNDTIGDLKSDLNHTLQPGEYRFTYSNSFPVYFFRQREVIISYLDKEKNYKYYTTPIYQYAPSSKAKFEIISVKDAVDERGNPCKLAEVKFSCNIKCMDNGAQYIVSDGHAILPFSGF
ncbi:MAG: hypothetical protein ACO1PI_14360 [Bacteroidota bacterium]|jgi:hypothetical protein